MKKTQVTARPSNFYTMTAAPIDGTLITVAANIGIDSHLEAFTRSTFVQLPTGFVLCSIHKSEIQILIRRLLTYAENFDCDHADSLVDFIVGALYLDCDGIGADGVPRLLLTEGYDKG